MEICNLHDLINSVEHAFEGILGVFDAVYMALYEQHFPALGRRFDSTMDF